MNYRQLLLFANTRSHNKPQLETLLHPSRDPEGLETFDCPVCHTSTAVIEDEYGFHCRTCKQRFHKSAFDDVTDPDLTG